jgi:hypothetical protein
MVPVLDLVETEAEEVVTLETMADVVGCSRYGVRAEAKGRMMIDIRDVACFGSPARLRWIKRRWRCVYPHRCPDLAERSDHVRRPSGADTAGGSGGVPAGGRGDPAGVSGGGRARRVLVDGDELAH